MRFKFFISLLFIINFSYGQVPGPVANTNSSSLFLRSAICTNSTAITSMASGAKLYALSTENACSGYNWIKVDVVGNHYVSAPNQLYCAFGSGYMQAVTENYLTVVNAPNGLFVRAGPGGLNLWVNNDYAVIENGQKFIATGQTQMLNRVLWYKIYVPTNVKTSVNGASAQYGWISGQYLTYSGCNFPLTPAIAMASSATSNGFRANWNVSANSTSYLLDVSTNSSFSNLVSPYNNFNVGNVNGYVVTGLNPNTTYYYRVRGSNNCGQSGNSSYSSCATSSACVTQPTAFTLNTPAGSDITNSSVKLSWSPSGNANS